MKNKKNIVIKLAIIFMASFVLSFDNDCGTERLDVRTLTDKEAKLIKWIPITTSVKGLTKLVQPFPVEEKKKKKGTPVFDKSKRFGYEFNIYSVQCKIREFRKEDDGDYHLVLVDIKDSTCTMIGEILNTECLTLKGSSFMNSFKAVREEFEKVKLPNNKVQSGIYTLMGVCFFDKIHGQLGVAPNGVELHPIMDFVHEYERK